MSFWHKSKYNLKYDIAYIMYMGMAVSFYMMQHSAKSLGERGFLNFSEFVEEILSRDMAFLRVVILLPLCILTVLHIRYYFWEQFVIRQRSRRRIYFKILQACAGGAVLFSVLFLIIAICAGTFFWVDSQGIQAAQAMKLLCVAFGIFFTMAVVNVSLKWLVGNDIPGIILVCGLGISDSISCNTGLHIVLTVILMAVIFLTAEKKEFYHEKYKNDKV